MTIDFKEALFVFEEEEEHKKTKCMRRKRGGLAPKELKCQREPLTLESLNPTTQKFFFVSGVVTLEFSNKKSNDIRFTLSRETLSRRRAQQQHDDDDDDDDDDLFFFFFFFFFFFQKNHR